MKYLNQESILDHYLPHVILERLSPYISDTRKKRMDDVVKGRLNSIQLALESPSDINNAFAAVRTAEALGISHVHIISTEKLNVKARSISQGAIFWVDIHFHETLTDFLIHIKKQNLLLAGGTVDAIQTLSSVPVEQALCLLMGNERLGLSEAAQAACDIRYKINMVGMSESMNLSVSAAISLYDTSQRKRIQLNQLGDLNTEAQLKLKAKYYLNGLSPRLVKNLLPTKEISQ